MKILHYSLGFPPYRTGGLTKYSMDLMHSQYDQGHWVGLLWPGRIGIVNNQQKIKERGINNKILSFELVNPLPIALDEGILEVEPFMKIGDSNIYRKFFLKYKPDVLHIHTLMGLHKECIEVAHELGIKTVFTTHDYYGLCPKVTFYRYGRVCEGHKSCEECVTCNVTALSFNKIKIMQSPLYRIFKDSKVVKKIRSNHRAKFYEDGERESDILNQNEINEKSNQYRDLRDYYISMLEQIEMIHFNSTITEKIYTKYFLPKDSCILNITHNDIRDNRKSKNYNHDVLRISYLGPTKPYKGYNLIQNTLDKLWLTNQNEFQLNIFSNPPYLRPYIKVHKSYDYSSLEKIFDNTDVLVAPSIWNETFGFTVLEAISYGVPVIITDNMGAKDLLINNEIGIVIEANIESFYKNISVLLNNRNILKKFNNNICNMEFNFNSNNIVEQLYYEKG